MKSPVHVLEKVSRAAPLGVRFRDESTGLFIGDGLVVEASPASRPSLRRRAFVTSSNVWVLQDLPGLRDFELNGGETLPGAPRKRFTIEVLDTAGRFLPLSFQAELPQPVRAGLPPPFRGLFVLECASPEPFVPLFSAPQRQTPLQRAVLRAELWDTSTEAPAAWALLEARVGDGPPARGLADENGRAALFFPYPAPEDLAPGAPGAGSASSQGRPPHAQSWTLRLTASYARRAPVPGFPNLCDTLAQPPARLWPDLNGGQEHLELTLHSGQELVVSTRGDSLSRLRLTSTGSPS